MKVPCTTMQFVQAQIQTIGVLFTHFGPKQ